MGSLKQFAALSLVSVAISGTPALGLLSNWFRSPQSSFTTKCLDDVYSADSTNFWGASQTAGLQYTGNSQKPEPSNEHEVEPTHGNYTHEDVSNIAIRAERRLEGHWDHYQLNCMGADGFFHGDVLIKDVKPQIDYLRGLRGECHVGGAYHPDGDKSVTRAVCSRISCDLGAGIFFCNYEMHPIHRSCRSLADFGDELILRCNKSAYNLDSAWKTEPGFPPGQAVIGQLGAKDGKYVVRLHAC